MANLIARHPARTRSPKFSQLRPQRLAKTALERVAAAVVAGPARLLRRHALSPGLGTSAVIPKAAKMKHRTFLLYPRRSHDPYARLCQQAGVVRTSFVLTAVPLMRGVVVQDAERIARSRVLSDSPATEASGTSSGLSNKLGPRARVASHLARPTFAATAPSSITAMPSFLSLRATRSSATRCIRQCGLTLIVAII